MPLNIDVVPDRPYKVDPSVSERRYRALRLISQLLTMTDLYDAHHREMLSIAMWKWTEAVGVQPYAKYNIPLVSARVMDRNEPVKVHHEHVWARKWMVDRLLAERPWSEMGLREFLEEHGVACIVTVEEHGRLGAVRGQGWTRYLAAGVEVWDRKAQRPLYPVAAEASISVGDGQPADLEPTQPRVETEADMTADRNVEEAIAEKAPGLAVHLHRLVRGVRDNGAECVVGGADRYIRVHDTLISEPTPAVAYVHWNGRVSVRLGRDDLPGSLSTCPAIELKEDRGYNVKVRVTDDASVEVAERLVQLALEKLREDRSAP